MFKSNQIIGIIFFIFLFISSGHLCAKQNNVLKLALLDTPYNEMPLNLSLISEYQTAYLAGIETAARVAKNDDIDIKYKPFFYGDGSLDILGETPKIQAWKADLVIGPSSSDQFTLLKEYLPDIMVLSSYASGKTLKSLPRNFHSIFLPDDRIMALLVGYIHKKFPEKNIYIITQADCKQCVDVSQMFISNYQTISPTKNIVEKKIIMDDINAIDSKKLMANHEDDVTLIFNVTNYAYNVLVKHIAAAFPHKKLIFFSDQDNWGEIASDDKHRENNLGYESYRIGPLLLNDSLPDFKRFSETYFAIYQTKPKYDVSYMTYITVMSAIQALKQYGTKNTQQAMREKLLTSYIEALKNNPNWFRANNYGIYQLTAQGEILTAKLPYKR